MKKHPRTEDFVILQNEKSDNFADPDTLHLDLENCIRMVST